MRVNPRGQQIRRAREYWNKLKRIERLLETAPNGEQESLLFEYDIVARHFRRHWMAYHTPRVNT